MHCFQVIWIFKKKKYWKKRI